MILLFSAVCETKRPLNRRLALPRLPRITWTHLELINSKGYARVIDIAAALNISQASVTNMVQRLDAEGLLKYEKYRGLILTATGKKLARRIAQRHKLLTDFLRLLGVDDRVIHHDVEGMEHHISPSTLRAIAAVTRQLQRRPSLRAQLQAGAL